jgi:hypothetical protein
MNRTEISKQLAEQENRVRLASQASQMERIKQTDAERLAELTEQMAKLAEAMAAMTGETQTHMREMERTVRGFTREAGSALSQARRAGNEIQSASSRITWKMGIGMVIAATLAAPAAVSAYLLLQRHYGAERAQAAEWRDLTERRKSLTSAEAQRISRILHWDQGR